MDVEFGISATAAHDAAIPSSKPNNDAHQRKEAACDFEALLIGQLMHSMRSASGEGWLGTGEDQAGSTMGDFAEQCLSRVIAEQGGLGLASLIEQGLTPKEITPPPETS